LLIVDDEPAQVRLFQLSLEYLGLTHLCHSAANGSEALAFLYRRTPYEHAPRPELIIMDLNLPGMDGCRLVSLIKSDPELRSIPVIMLSNSAHFEDVASCYSALANAYIQKPASFNSNLEIVQALDRFWFQTVTLPQSV
jgi:CheY-like chemotaxis protein